MTRTLLVFSAVTAILASVITSQAQTAKVYRVAWIAPERPAAIFNTFHQEMRRLGYVEGENLTFELRIVEAKPERISGWWANWFASTWTSSLLCFNRRSKPLSKQRRPSPSSCSPSVIRWPQKS